jgi:hypothetical protein
MLTNTCFTFVSADEAMHSAAVYAFEPAARTFKPVAGAGGTSVAPSAAEADDARAWAGNVWADTLG